MIFGREPALWTGVVTIIVNLAVSFGLHLTPEQIGLINALAIAIGALIVRQSVTPLADPKLDLGTAVNRNSAVVTGADPTTTPAAFKP